MALRIRTAMARCQRLLPALIILFALPAPNFASAQTLPNNGSGSESLVALNMRDVDIRALIQWIAEQTHKQIVIDPRVQGRVSAYADKPMAVGQAYQVFLALLEVYGYSSSEIDGVLRIYPGALAKNSSRTVIDNFNQTSDRNQIAYVLNIKTISSAAMAQLIKPLLSPTGYIASLDTSNDLLIADNGDSVKQLAELAKRLDNGGSLDIAIIKLQHTNARDVAQTLTTLLPRNEGSRNIDSSAGSSLSIATDERSNSILLAGEPSSRLRAQQLIERIDKPITTVNSTRVVFLHYLSSEEVLPILKGETSKAQTEAREESIKNAAVSLEASKSNNAIVMSGPPNLLDTLQSIIAKLDVERAQVFVEAIIVEVNADTTDDLGVVWATKNLNDLSGSGVISGVNALGNLNTVSTITTIGSDGSAVTQAAPGNGLTLGYYTGGNMQAAIRALRTHSKANILSTPSIITLDHQEAQIIVGSNIPIITGQTTSDASSTSNPFTTFERKDIGVTLKITPQINTDKSVTLKILQEIQNVADTANTSLSSAADIVTIKRSVSTEVQVADDNTVVLGGLISNGRQNAESKVPLLGDMPLIGGLFRSTRNQNTQQNLLVFIRPRIIDKEALAQALSRNQYEQARAQQMQNEKSERARLLPEFEAITPQKNDRTANTENQ
ncbi:MAG: type II secretion system secretin GspD [Spongiibacteraceae bacterium]